MKKLLTIATATATIALAGTAIAATANLSVSASITNACSVTGGTLNFGSLNTLTAPLVSVNSSGVSITCTKGAGYTVSADAGVNKSGTQAYLKNTGNSDKIPYSISIPGVSAGTGSAQDLAISGTIIAGSYTTASAGTYEDTITLTVNP